MENIITIKYKKYEFVNKEYEIKVNNLHYCFFEGGQDDTNITDYFGIWTTDTELKICEIISQDTIKIKNYRSKGIYTYCDIKRFLEKHYRIQQISEETFKKELNKVLKRLE